MSGNKFTPGPWEVSGATHVYSMGKRGGNVCAVSEPRATSLVGYTPIQIGGKDFSEACANAKLIAAAPEMFDAIKRFCVAFEGNKAARLGNGVARKALDKFNAIIAKAEGKN